MGITPKWTDAQLRRVIGRMTDREAAKRLGLSISAIGYHRARLGIPAHRTKTRRWTKRELRLLGTLPDGEIAKRLGCSRKHVFETRKRLGVAAFSLTARRKNR